MLKTTRINSSEVSCSVVLPRRSAMWEEDLDASPELPRQCILEQVAHVAAVALPTTPVQSYLDMYETGGPPSPVCEGDSPHSRQYKYWCLRHSLSLHPRTCSDDEVESILDMDTCAAGAASSSTETVHGPVQVDSPTCDGESEDFLTRYDVGWCSGLADYTVQDEGTSSDEVDDHCLSMTTACRRQPLSRTLAQFQPGRKRDFKFGSCPTHSCARSAFVFGPNAAPERRGRPYVLLVQSVGSVCFASFFLK